MREKTNRGLIIIIFWMVTEPQITVSTTNFIQKCCFSLCIPDFVCLSGMKSTNKTTMIIKDPILKFTSIQTSKELFAHTYMHVNAPTCLRIH